MPRCPRRGLGCVKQLNSGRVSRAVLLHSGGMSSRQWGRLAERLHQEGHDVVAPDFRGHGDGALWPGGPVRDFAFDVDLALGLMEGPTHLVGHSYGGLIALLAARGREDVCSVSVYEPIAFGALRAADDEEGLRDLDRLDGDPRFIDPAAAGTDDWLQLFVDYWSGAGAWDGLGKRGQSSFRESAHALADTMPALMAESTPATAYRSISAPLLVVRGDAGPLSARRAGALVAEAVPGARLETIAGAGHMGPLTHRDAVNDLVVAHVRASGG